MRGRTKSAIARARRRWRIVAPYFGFAIGAAICRLDAPLDKFEKFDKSPADAPLVWMSTADAGTTPATRPATSKTERERLSLIPEFPRAAGGPFPFGAQDLSVWRARVPRIQPVEIPSTADGLKQRALF